MPVPVTDIKFSDIWSEANGTYSSGQLSMLTMSFFSYFAGPNGSNSLPSNNYGVTENTGKNRIYGLSYKASNPFDYGVGDYANITYFYDNTNFAGQDVVIGRYYTDLDAHYIDGYISNVRIVNGTSLYSSDFTIPNTPLSATSSMTTSMFQPFTDFSLFAMSTLKSLVKIL